MSTSDFHSRPQCPAWDAPGEPVIFRFSSEPRLRAALLDFYARVDRLDYDALGQATYAVSACPRCRTWFQTNISSNPLLARLYEEWIGPEKARLRFHHNHSHHHSLPLAREVALSLSMAQLGAPRTSLDYGCGWGEWGRMTQAFGFDSWGTESSSTRRAHAEKSAIHARALKNFDRKLTRPRLGGLNAIAPLKHLNAFTQTGLLHLAAKAKALMRPFYLRSRLTTQLYLRHAPVAR